MFTIGMISRVGKMVFAQLLQPLRPFLARLTRHGHDPSSSPFLVYTFGNTVSVLEKIVTNFCYLSTSIIGPSCYHSADYSRHVLSIVINALMS